MSSEEPSDQYILGETDAEHERLIRQAKRLAPVTERFFREAGIGSGQHVLDLGCGVGDVAMLVARIVGPSGSVVALERSPRTLDRARRRAAEAGLSNIEFIETDVNTYETDRRFDAIVGRYILQFLPDPVATLCSVARRLRPGGIVAFQEGSWIPFVELSAHVPLYHASASLLREHGRRAGVHLEMGPALYRVFQDAGLPAPRMRLEMEMAADPDFVRWVSDSLQSVLPSMQRLGLAYETLGDINTLQTRLQEAVAQSKAVVPWLGLVGAWCRTSNEEM